MIPPPDWFSRKFSFDFAVDIYPGVVERLRGTPARLHDLASALPPIILTQRDGNEWSIQEHAGHLLDLSELDHARLEDYENNAAVLRIADLTNQKTFQADHNASSLLSIIQQFREVRGSLVSKLELLDPDFIQRTALHPRMNIPMRVVDWCYFVAEHDDHHLAFISLLIRKLAR